MTLYEKIDGCFECMLCYRIEIDEKQMKHHLKTKHSLNQMGDLLNDI